MQSDHKPENRRIALKTLMASAAGAVAVFLFRPRAAAGQTRTSLAILEARINALEADLAALSTSANSLIAPGAICPFAGAFPLTADWLLCDGSVVSRAAFADLFAVIGTIYSAGDGSSTFGLPDLRGRTAIGVDDMGGAPAGRVISHPGGMVLGGSGGVESHALSVGELPSHSHGVTDPGHMHAVRSANDDFSGSGSASGVAGIARSFDNGSYLWPTNGLRADPAVTNMAIQATGSSQPHDNMPPFLTLNWIIKT
jgi:microcystin-dependent protein